MDFGVLADLEGGEMEAERLDLPAEVLNLPVGDARHPVRDQAGLKLRQLLDELLGRLVVPGHRARLLGEVPASAAQALGNRPHAAAVRLVGEAASQIAHRLGQLFGIAGEAVLELRVDPLARDLGRQRRQKPCRHRLVAAQDVVGVDARDLASELRSNRRIAVTVASYPRAPLQESGYARRPRTARAGIAGGPDGASPPACDSRPVHGSIEGAVDARHRPEQRLVEEREGRANLVDRARSGLAHRGGPPQQADLLAQLAHDFGLVNDTEARIVELLQKPIATAQGDQRRAPAGFGGMGSQDRRDPQPPQQLLDPIGGPITLAQPVDGRLRRAFGRLSRLLGSVEPANLVAFLAQVDELKVQAEGIGQRLGLVDRQ